MMGIGHWWMQCALLSSLLSVAAAFVAPSQRLPQKHLRLADTPQSPGYVPLSEPSITTGKRKKYPKIGDVVKYYDLDGGRADGEVLVGKIRYIQQKLGEPGGWLAEISEMEDVGDGYFAEYSSRLGKRALRNVEEISPLAASWVRTEAAYKIPLDKGIPLSRREYDLDDYRGPTTDVVVNPEVLRVDTEQYEDLKLDLLKSAAIAALTGTVTANLVTRSVVDTIIYAVGALSSVGYLFLLSLKTDTVGSAEARFGNKFSNFRFVLPLFVLASVAVYNQISGTIQAEGVFHTVSTEQFACAMIGFLTYRVPLFINQLFKPAGEAASQLLPGSAGVALALAKEAAKKADVTSSPFDEETTPILVVSGPHGTNRSKLVKKLVEEGEGRFVAPKYMDRVKDGITFELAEQREKIILMSDDERYGITKDGILDLDISKDSAVVIDASVDEVKKLTNIDEARVIGVWVSLGSLEKFESGLLAKLERGEIEVPEGETQKDVMRANIRAIVADIEYGVISGVFEFTILDDEFDDSLRQLKAAAEYCFK